MKHYHINIFYIEEDGGYIADIPDLPCCSAFGATPEDALAELRVVQRAWLETTRREGRSIPEPSYRPEIYGTRR
ncbi:MAG: type II toxin-antitoxin system HicB family antitoxin [Planctomycetota bacterium]|jgi:predicted RNase H-like HicB family nuclease